MKTNFAKRFLALFMAGLMVCMLAVSAHAMLPSISEIATSQSTTVDDDPTLTTTDELISSVDGTKVTAKNLMDLKACLEDVAYLENRVHGLEDCNTFSKDSFLMATSQFQPTSIWDQLSKTSQKAVSQLSTYQALFYIQQTPEYADNADLRNATETYLQIMTASMSSFTAMSMWRFVPNAVMSELNPDQLCELGEMIISTEVYQDLKTALDPLIGFHSEADLSATPSPAEMTLRYDEILRPALKLWPNLEWRDASKMPTGTTGGN